MQPRYEPSFFHNIIKPPNTSFYSKNRNIYSAIFIHDSIMMCSCVDQSIKIRLECKQQIQELKAIIEQKDVEISEKNTELNKNGMNQAFFTI